MGKYLFSNYEDFTKEDSFDFSKHSSIGVGGRAKLAVYPKNGQEITKYSDSPIRIEPENLKTYAAETLGFNFPK